MARLLVHVEGQTEEAFVNELLRGHLLAHGYESVSARIIGNARQRSHRGGIRSWSSVRKDIVRHLKEDPSSLSTTMIDYYGMPRSGERAWPGRAQAPSLATGAKGQAVENALLADVVSEMGENFDRRRFVPFVVMHEFEGLLFSDCALFARAIYQPQAAHSFQAIRDSFDTPEDINDAPNTAPSKRVAILAPAYDKPLFGVLAALDVGLARMREACPQFRKRLVALEAIGTPRPP
jgi:hypothetical protein